MRPRKLISVWDQRLFLPLLENRSPDIDIRQGSAPCYRNLTLDAHQRGNHPGSMRQSRKADLLWLLQLPVLGHLKHLWIQSMITWNIGYLDVLTGVAPKCQLRVGRILHSNPLQTPWKVWLILEQKQKAKWQTSVHNCLPLSADIWQAGGNLLGAPGTLP